MRAQWFYCLIVTCLSFYTLSTVGRVLLFERPSGQVLASQHLEHKREPSTPQEQSSINVPVPGQQWQNATSTADAGYGTSNDPGMVTNSAVTNGGVDCFDLTTGRDNKCWDVLNLTIWVNDWVGSNACYQDEPFASCFLRKEGFPGLDCTGIKVSSCTAPQGESLMRKPRVFYVAYNIYGKL